MANSRYVVAVSRDITAERRRQHRLGLLASVFSNAVEGVAILDQQGLILEANPKLLELFGLDQHSLEGQSLQGLLGIDAATAETYWQSLRTESSWTGKVTYQHPDGRRHWFRLSLSTTAQSAAEDGGNAACQVIALFADITQLEESQQRLEYQSRHDALTGLANRQYFTDELAFQLEKRQGDASELAVILLALDDFKGINDNFGYDTGDLILAQVARRLRASFDAADLIARIGGDEFAILVTDPQCQGRSAERWAQQVLAFSQVPYQVGDAEAIVNTSIGIASYPSDGDSAATLMSNADIAMYQAKAAGKNQWMRFSSAMQSKVARRHALHAALREVIHADGLTMYYQPKVDAKTGRPAGCEALVPRRWQHGVAGRVHSDRRTNWLDLAIGRFGPQSRLADRTRVGRNRVGLVAHRRECLHSTVSQSRFRRSTAGQMPTLPSSPGMDRFGNYRKRDG
jgi:diguanylate cyclase (GGDEF)-like protein/PAS domain S-box-containing protein